MGLINILDRSVFELIAAGEVVERPASVVKELVENSIDAGAKKIKVEIKNGGVTYIKITDDGCGVHKDDVRNAFLRHATSKVCQIKDLDNILTLGFRGEALASICAVSKVEFVTRTADEKDGIRYLISENQEKSFEEVGAPVGTTIVVRDLFFNVPARMKFLKRDVTEGNAVAMVIEKLALSHPEISFSFIREGQEKLYTFGDGDLLSTLYCVFGKEFASKMLKLEYREDKLLISGYISDPANSKGSRVAQNFFVNSRYIKSKTCYVALEEAYKSFVTSGKFPACVLNIEIPSSVVDINVHPAKLEVRFANEKMIYHLVYAAVKNCILSNYQNPVFDLKNNVNKALSNFSITHGYGGKNSFFEDKLSPDLKTNSWQNLSKQSSSNMLKQKIDNYLANSLKPIDDSEKQVDKLASTINFNKSCFVKTLNENSKAKSLENNEIDIQNYKSLIDKANEVFELLSKDSLLPNDQSEVNEHGKVDLENQQNEFVDKENGEDNNVVEKCVSYDCCDDGAQNNIDQSDMKKMGQTRFVAIDESVENQKDNNKFIGEVFNSYIILERSSEIVLIDKHAAHERTIYEKIKDGKLKSHRQVLLTPQVIDVSLTEYQAAIDNIDIFENIGFLVEDFGEKAVIVREIPLVLSERNAQDVTDIITEIISNIISYKNNLTPVAIEKIYYSFACKAAIKAGDKNHEIELKELVDILEKNKDFTNCPHGRPISFVIRKKDIEKQFMRF